MLDEVVVFCPPGPQNKKKHLHAEVNITVSLNL